MTRSQGTPAGVEGVGEKPESHGRSRFKAQVAQLSLQQIDSLD